MATLDSSIVNVALPTLQHEFGVAVTLIEWVSIAYLTITTGLLLPFGKLGDTAGRRRIYLVGMVLFTLGSALCGLAGSAAFLIASRVVQGVGAAMLSSNSVALVTAAFPREIRGRALGAVGAVVGLGLTIGPPLGGLLLSTLGWHAIFYVNLPFGIAAIVMALRVMARDEPGGRPL
jgi:MFS family permease